MSLVTIQWTDYEWYQPVMLGLERSCLSLGHSVFRWLGNGRLKPCDFFMRWGCNISPNQAQQLSRDTGAKVLYLERGWTHDRNDCCQLDFRGVGGRVSWAEDPLQYTPGSKVRLNQDGHLLVVLRYEHREKVVDNVQELCPHFQTNLEWLRHLSANCGLPVKVRPHPETSLEKNYPVQDLVRRRGWIWDTSTGFDVAAETAMAVAVQDSTAGVWALEMGLPVLCWGKQVYRHPGVVEQMTADGTHTRQVTDGLSKGVCSIDSNAVLALLDRVRSRQYYAKDHLLWSARLRREFGM